MGKNEYDEIFWKRIEKLSFFYPLSQIWKLSSLTRKIVLVLWIISVLGIGFIIYTIVYNKLVNQNSSIVFIFWVAVISVLLSIVAIIYILFDKCRFNAWIYSKWIEIEMWGRLFSELKWVKIFQYNENWYEYVKLIYTEYDDIITTETLLYNPKMDKFLEKFQKTFQNHGITCEKISDIRWIDISDPIEYKVRFWFLSTRKLLSCKEKRERIKGLSKVYLYVLLLFLFLIFFDKKIIFSFSFEEVRSRIPIFFTFAWILLISILLYFVFSSKKFYARMENNAVYIRKYTWLTANYLLSKIKCKYWFVSEWNVEWIMLTIDDDDKTSIYKWPKNEEVERFCNDLLSEVKERKKL